ncbi:fibrillin-2-like isoform X3 [Patiria miniata]|uniref:Uncharacterized protein n=1 Tax=Patiria miniata TaxID=46514 RepID=A0A914B9P7_PATMI|nr:fibrillin-2-like isoform X3 [Patiria miniata]
MAWRGCLVMWVAVCLVTRLRLVTAQNDRIDSGENDRPPCDQPPGIENGSYEAYNHGASVSYSCDEGYQMYTFGSRERHCQENGRWSGSTPVCSAGGCSEDDAPVVPFSSVSRYNGGTVRWHRCHTGFEPQGPGSTVTYCDGTRWRNQLSQCVRAVRAVRSTATCGLAPRIENARVTQGAGGLVTYTCAQGYKARLGVGSIRCGADGQWIGSPSVCIRQGCQVPRTTAVQDGIINIKHEGAMLKIGCRSGYEIRGSSVLFCNGRVWNGTLPTCQLQSGGYPATVLEGDRCGTAPRVENANPPVYVNKYDASRTFFYAITYRCHHGFTLYPSNYAVYCSAGSVVGTPPNCLSTCGYQNGGCQQICRNGADGAICSCRDGYKLASDGKTCQGQGCQVPRNTAVQNGIINIKNAGAMLKIECRSGYKIRGSSVLFCNGLVWNGTLPTCQLQSGGYPATVLEGDRCGTAPRVENANPPVYVNKYDASRTFFYAITYRCHHGFTLYPANYAVYCSAGSVVGTPPNCLSTCGNRNGGCQQICRNGPHGAICSCRDGYKLASDGKTCQDFNECSTNVGRGPCQHICYNSPGSFVCYCHSGFNLAPDKTSCIQNQGRCNCGEHGECVYAWGVARRCRCIAGYKASTDGFHCLVMPCSCGAGTNTCSQPDGQKICTCLQGYRPAVDGTSCVDVDECQESRNSLADCQAACYNTQGSYSCSCPQRWLRLAADERSCEEIPCSCGRYSTSCSQPDGVKICTCADGYKPAPNGASCVDRNECVESNICQGQCTNTWGSYNCRCTESGYRLAADRHSCEDIDECQNSRSHDCQHACVNVPGTYRCDCPPGNILMPDGRSCQECRPNSYRNATANECLECPAHSRTIGRGKASIRDCLCSPGYTGDYTSDIPCKDINECEQDNGKCKQHCINTPGSFYCACPNGYMLMDDGSTCQDHNECSQSNGGCQHQCFNTGGSFVCDCNDGHTVDPSDPYLCADIDECRESGDGLADCEAACRNTLGSYYCLCPQEWLRLAADKRTCEVMPCSCGAGTDTCSQPDGQKICACLQGYRPAVDGTSCVDIDECQESGNSLADCQAACYNTQGSYSCSCPQRWLRLAADERSCEEIPCSCGRYSTSCSQPDGVKICTCADGYKPAPNGASCIDRNECVESNICQGQCTNTWGSYNCRCTESGYRLAADRHSCEDHDECSQSNGGCQHQCFNTEGSFVCDCSDGYTVDPSDPYLCAAVTCSPLVLSENMNVSPRDHCLGTHATNQIIVGTTCRLGCKNGYELQGNARKTCQNTGRWSGEPVACNPVRCPGLQHPDHGLVSPPSCLQDGEIEFSGICAYSCDEGYTLIGSSLTNCQACGEWSNEKPSCSEVSEVTCPRDVSVVLEPGESHAVVDLPKPVHTLDRLEASVPAVGHPFPAGRTTVTYTAWSNSTESLATCSLTVIVTDEEPPVFEFCPESFTVNTQEQYPEIEWEPPVATDNVAVVGNNTWISPEGRFTWGTYTFLTDVRDAAGNSATCKFSISIQTVVCGKPNGPLNGESGCSDWMFGKICEPRCNQSYYFFDGPPENVYLCGFFGVWWPSREVPDCSPYSYLGNQTTCPTGTELKSFTVLEDPVCIACPRGMYYSAAAGSMPSCLPCAMGTYQGGFGQESCVSCPAGQTTATEAAISSSECFLIEEVTVATTTTQPAGPVQLNEHGVS